MNIKLARTNKQLSSHAGLLTTDALLRRTRLHLLLVDTLPKLKSGQGRSLKKFSDLVQGFVAGADCLDDMGRLGQDPAFLALCDAQVYTPKAYGDFLRSFLPSHIYELQSALRKLAFSFRHQLFPDERQFFFDCDSTSNRQHGSKMQGVAVNFGHYPCLDTLDVFDQFGLQYYINVRPGNTYTATGIEPVIHEVMSDFHSFRSKHETNWKACFRADRGYYNVSFLNSCFAKNADVVIGVRQDENFKFIIGQIHNWRRQDDADDKRIKFYDGRECEIGSTHFRPKGAARRLRYIVIRAQKDPGRLFPGHIEYDYYAFATTYDAQFMNDEDVIRCYRKRGQAENYIKENKYGLDLKHYPCLKLDANRAYAVIAAFAYNFMRFMALSRNPTKPYYAKNIRFHWINIPCQVVRTGGDVFIRVMNKHYQEIKAWLERIQILQFEYA